MEESQEISAKKPSFIQEFLFEIIFVFLLLFIFLFSLNFFNILHIEKNFPIFSFLPHLLEKEQVTTSSTLPISQKDNSFVYDAKKAEEGIKTNVKLYLKPQDIPSHYSIIHQLDSANEPKDTPFTYGAHWELSPTVFSIFYHFNMNSNEQSDFSILITTPATTLSPKTQLMNYFRSNAIPTNLSCKIVKAFSLCENFGKNALGDKQGIGIVQGLTNSDTNQQTNLLFFCYIPSKSDHFGWNSCVQKSVF